MTEYEPGTCNINQVERKKRLVMGLAGFVNATLLAVVLFAFPSFTPLYAGIFILNLTGFLGYLQYRYHFCAGLAIKQKFKVGDSEEEVPNSEQVSKDRKKALIIAFESLAGSFLLTYLLYLIFS